MSFTDVFGGSTLYPSQVSYLAVTLSAANITLEWPLESDAPTYPAARILDVTSSNSRSITLPDATLAAPGETILFNNLSASSTSFTVKDAGGSTVATVGVGTAWQLYLAGVATAAGTWRSYQMGASTASVNPAALAGYGITVTSSTLSQSTPTEDFTVSPFTLAADDRAKLVIWAGSGAGEIDLLSAATAGDNYFFLARNDSEGILTLDPDGSDLIDGDSSLVMQPGDSAQLVTDGVNWFSVGMGQQPVFAFDYTLVSLAGAGATYTLSGSELNRIAYSFTGALSNNVNVVVPNTYQQYWVANNTTGAYTLTISTDGGTAVGVTQGARDILYCNGANVVDADTASLSVPITASQGGTGQTSYTIGDILYASGASTLSKLAGVATGNALISGGVATAPSWGKIALSTHVSGVLPSGNGGGYKTLNAQSGTSYTLALSDAFGLVTLSNAAAITLTVPANATVAFPVGYYVDLLQLGAGQVTVTAAGGVTLRNTSGLLIADQYGVATALKIATDEWVVFGGLTA